MKKRKILQGRTIGSEFYEIITRRSCILCNVDPAAAISYVLGRAGGPMEFQMRMRLRAYEIVNKDFRQDAAHNRSSREDRRIRRLREGIKNIEGEKGR